MGRLLRAAVVCSFVLSLAAACPRAALAAEGGRRVVPVLVPQAGNLELLAFWVALGGGYFAREGLDVQVVTPDSPSLAVASVKQGTVPVALLPGPDYERLIADRAPVLITGNLFENDPLEIVLRREVADRIHLPGAPLGRRLSALRGISLGVTVRDRARLYELFHSEGLDANLVQIIVLKEEEQLAALAANRLDGVYAAPPTLDAALLDHDAVIYIDPAAGEIPALAERLVQAVVVTSAFANERPNDVQAFIRAIGKAEHLVHFEPGAATAALLRALPSVDPKHATTVVKTYARAVPATPHVEAQLLTREARFYPVGGATLDLRGIDLEAYVRNGIGFEAAAPASKGAPQGTAAHAGSSPRAALALIGALALALALLVIVLDQREPAKDARDGAA